MRQFLNPGPCKRLTRFNQQFEIPALFTREPYNTAAGRIRFGCFKPDIAPKRE
jgi:hypothetical protein